MRPRLSALVAVASGAVLALGPAVAPASAVAARVGANPTANSTCNGQTYVQTASPDGTYRVPFDGVVTSWRYVPAGTINPSSRIALKIGRAQGAGYQLVASSASIPFTTAGTYDVPARIGVRAGDLLGFGATFYSGCGSNTLPSGSTPLYPYATADDDATTGPLTPTTNNLQLNISAVVESDDDGDGFGDTTQDRCSTDASTQGPCPVSVVPVVPAADRTAPQTTITSVVAAKARSARKKATVTMAFRADEASTFECAVDSPVFVACRSPFVVRLRVGKHTLAVRATDAAGNVDRTAAVATVAVKVGKAKK